MFGTYGSNPKLGICKSECREAGQCKADVVAHICLQYGHINKEKFKTYVFFLGDLLCFICVNEYVYVCVTVCWVGKKLPRLIV